MVQGSAPAWSYYTQQVLLLRSLGGFWGRRRFGPHSLGSKLRLRISWVQGARMPGPWGSCGVAGSMWNHAYQKAETLVLRSHHHQQQSMNEYEATFMNILLSVIFLFQLSFSLFFPAFQHSQIFCCSNLPLALPRFIFLWLCLSLLLWCVLGHRVLYHKG